jgi:hypothetical protein
MSFFARDPCKTDIEETKIKYSASQAMLRCNADSYIDFMMQKLLFVKGNDDPRLRLEMIQDDKWLSAGFHSFNSDVTRFPSTPVVPLYISNPTQFKRVLCDTCEDHFSCSRNFKGKCVACCKCKTNLWNAKRQKLNPQDVDYPEGTGNSSTGSNGSNGSAIRAARALDAASWRTENYNKGASANPREDTSESSSDSD